MTKQGMAHRTASAFLALSGRDALVLGSPGGARRFGRGMGYGDSGLLQPSIALPLSACGSHLRLQLSRKDVGSSGIRQWHRMQRPFARSQHRVHMAHGHCPHRRRSHSSAPC
jgi:hypothetical protein